MDAAAADQVITSHFYLTGGTALSVFYLHHRISEDLDFFTEDTLDEKAIASWSKETGNQVGAEISLQTLRGELEYYFNFPKDVIRVDFAQFPFPPLGVFNKYKNLRIASIEDIATNKIQAIMSRTRGRDYVDLHEIMKNQKVTVDMLVKNFKLKFDVTIPPEQLARRFTAVVDASDQPRFLGKTRWRDVESFFLKLSKALQIKIII